MWNNGEILSVHLFAYCIFHEDDNTFHRKIHCLTGEFHGVSFMRKTDIARIAKKMSEISLFEKSLKRKQAYPQLAHQKAKRKKPLLISESTVKSQRTGITLKLEIIDVYSHLNLVLVVWQIIRLETLSLEGRKTTSTNALFVRESDVLHWEELNILAFLTSIMKRVMVKFTARKTQ